MYDLYTMYICFELMLCQSNFTVNDTSTDNGKH